MIPCSAPAPVNSNASQKLWVYPSAGKWTTNTTYFPLFFRVNYLLYDHPVTRKVVEIAAYVIGAAVVVAACFTPAIPTLIGLASVGTLVIVVTYVASKILNCLVPKSHDMKIHAFHPEKCERNGKLLGELYYDNDVPVLKVHSNSNYDAGYAQGYLLKEALSDLRTNIDFFLFTLSREKKASEIRDVLNAIRNKIPQRFVLEMQGLVDGYNERKSYFDKTITFDDVLYLQLMPDKTYFKPGMMKVNAPAVKSQALIQTSTVACTVIGLHDKQGVPLLARMMDWLSFGKAGTFSLIISRINSATGIRTAEVTVPGLIGTLTGVNSFGLTTSMNVIEYEKGITSIEGIPTTFYNRMMLEECKSFDQAKTFVNAHKPLGPYHLTVSDQKEAGTFSMYQKEDWTGDWDNDKDNTHLLRLLTTEKALITTNCSCNPTKTDMFNGEIREAFIEKYLQKNRHIQEPRNVLEKSHSIPLVNNFLSIHRVILSSTTLEVAFDNAWAGDRTLHPLKLTEIFAESDP